MQSSEPSETTPPDVVIPPDQTIPAVFINRFSIRVGTQHTRLTFGEALVGTNASLRTAIVLSTTDARLFGELLLDTIDKHMESTEQTG
jgi:hypothetical protein